MGNGIGGPAVRFGSGGMGLAASSGHPGSPGSADSDEAPGNGFYLPVTSTHPPLGGGHWRFLSSVFYAVSGLAGSYGWSGFRPGDRLLFPWTEASLLLGYEIAKQPRLFC